MAKSRLGKDNELPPGIYTWDFIQSEKQNYSDLSISYAEKNTHMASDFLCTFVLSYVAVTTAVLWITPTFSIKWPLLKHLPNHAPWNVFIWGVIPGWRGHTQWDLERDQCSTNSEKPIYWKMRGGVRNPRHIHQGHLIPMWKYSNPQPWRWQTTQEAPHHLMNIQDRILHSMGAQSPPYSPISVCISTLYTMARCLPILFMFMNYRGFCL